MNSTKTKFTLFHHRHITVINLTYPHIDTLLIINTKLHLFFTQSLRHEEVVLMGNVVFIPGNTTALVHRGCQNQHSLLFFTGSSSVYLSCKLLLAKEGWAVFSLLACLVVVCPQLRPLTEDAMLDRVSACAGEGSFLQCVPEQ